MLILGDCLEKLKDLEDNSVDSIITDPPYGISFMGKKWDYDVPSVALWQETLRVLKPGGHALVACGTRTQHRMAVNLEDAGFEIRDIVAWVYSTGFPKSLNIGKAINKIDGVEFKSKPAEGVGFMNNDTEDGYHPTINQLEQVGESSERAKQWEGWGTALKPAMELWTLCRKPLQEKTVAENVLKYGTGGIIDGCRVGYKKGDDPSAGNITATFGTQETQSGGDGSGGFEANNNGRFPANLIHDGSDEVVSLFPNDAQRFYYTAKASKSERNRGLEGFEEKLNRKSGKGHCADTIEKNIHPTVKPVALMKYLCKLITPPKGIVLDPFMGSGSTGIACKEEGFDFIGIEREEEYIKIAEARINAVAEKLI
jgi:site-specific DNA-methyltransferase (adenine-specific)